MEKMKRYRIKSIATTGKGGKVLSHGEIVSEIDFPPNTIDSLIKSGHLELHKLTAKQKKIQEQRSEADAELAEVGSKKNAANEELKKSKLLNESAKADLTSKQEIYEGLAEIYETLKSVFEGSDDVISEASEALAECEIDKTEAQTEQEEVNGKKNSTASHKRKAAEVVAKAIDAHNLATKAVQDANTSKVQNEKKSDDAKIATDNAKKQCDSATEELEIAQENYSEKENEFEAINEEWLKAKKEKEDAYKE
jgi:chromosome segregation ATPase